MITFKDLPDTSTPINASNLNSNFEELEDKISDNPIVFKKYERQVNASVGQDYWEVAVNSIEGYELIGILPNGGNTNNMLVASNIKNNDRGIVTTVTYNYSGSVQTIKIKFTAVYVKSQLIV